MFRLFIKKYSFPYYVNIRYIFDIKGKKITGIKESKIGKDSYKHFSLSSSSISINNNNKTKQSNINFKDKYKNKIRGFFMPNNYPHSVQKDYWNVQKYWNIQWATSSALQVFATQAMLHSIGVGSTAGLPIAATANWVLKDVLACFGVMVAANKIGNYFDVYLKKSKWIGDIILNIGIFIEMCTQIFPSFFIVLASFATLLKAISGMINGSTKANINRYYASAVKGKNLGDVTAKGQSQGVFAFVIGLFYGISVSYVSQLCGLEYIIIPLNFIGLNIIHLFSSYKMLSNLNLPYLNIQRGNIITQAYLSQLNYCINNNKPLDDIKIPTPYQVAQEDVFISKYNNINNISVKMGSSINDILLNNNNNITLEEIIRNTNNNDKFIENYLIHNNNKNDTVYISFHSNASESDYIKSFFHSQIYIYNIQNNNNNNNTNDIWKISTEQVNKYYSNYIKILTKTGWTTKFFLFYEPKHTTTRFTFEIEK